MSRSYAPIAVLSLALAAPVIAGPTFEGQTAAITAEFGHLVSDMLGMTEYDLIMLDTTAWAPGSDVQMTLQTDVGPLRLELESHSVRSATYQLLVDDGTGILKQAEPGPVRTVRGTIATLPDSSVAGSFEPNGFFGNLRLDDEERLFIEPLAHHMPGVDPGLHLVYRPQDTPVHDGVCGVGDKHRAFGHHPVVPAEVEDGPLAGTATYCAELAIDADYEYFLDYGSVTAVENRINSVINSMNNQYENEVDITHEITAIVVRSNPSDPYTTSNPDTLLDQFRSEWIVNQGSIPRDVAQLFSGKNFSGSTIGLAWLSAVCTSLGYSIVESDFNNFFSCATDLSAHELGHNWSADHCSCGGNTMNPSITCANNFNNTQTEPQIIAYRNFISNCLDDCGDPPPAVYCEAASTQTGFEFISNVQLSSLNHSTGSDGYGDHTDQSTVLAEGLQYQLTITIDGGTATDIGGVWIDWNQDLDFDDALEQIDVSLSGPGPYVTTIFVPGGNVDGTTRMRIRVQDSAFNPPISSCGNTIRGEVEDYTLIIVEDPPPANDNCADATVVAAGVHPFTTGGATTDGPDDTSLCNLNGQTQIDSDVWFSYVATCDGAIDVNVCGASFDTKLAVYAGGCPTAPNDNIIGCSDDSCGEQSSLFVPVSAGETYLIRIGGFDGATGSGDLSITCFGTEPSPCPADLDESGTVGFNDLVALLSAWGPCGNPCVGDLDESGEIGFNDLVSLLSAWGPCPE